MFGFTSRENFDKLILAYVIAGSFFVFGAGLVLERNGIYIGIPQAEALPISESDPQIANWGGVKEGGQEAITLENYENVPIRRITNDKDVLPKAIEKIGIERLMTKLVEESNGGSAFDCHQEAHNIGRVGYTIIKQEAFGECDASCHSGCYHGAMEEFLHDKGTENIAEDIKSVCDTFDTGFERYECLHGVGHGLLAYVDYDLFQTIKDCERLNDGFSTLSCYGGMFMENILTGQGLGASKNQTHETKWVSNADPHFPCNALPKENYELRYQCYQMQTSWMLRMLKYDFNKVAEECFKAPADMIAVCFKSYGRDASGNSLRNPESIKKTCGNIDPSTHPDYYWQCILGAVNVIIDFWGPGLKGQAAGLCKILDEPSKGDCYSHVASRLSGLFKSAEEKYRICSTFEDSYKAKCVEKQT